MIYQQLMEDVVVSIGGSLGYTAAYASNPLRLTERFFVGGDNLRGFAVGGIGPRDLNTLDALGGKYFYTGTAEASFPLGLPKEIGITGKAFVDVGALWGAESTYGYNVNLGRRSEHADRRRRRRTMGIAVRSNPCRLRMAGRLSVL